MLVALQLTLVLVGLEGALRVRAWKRFGTSRPRIADVYLGKVDDFPLLAPIPGASIEGDRTSLHINSLGFRGSEFPFAKEPGELRIACVGASTTFCAEASSDEWTWPARLQAQLEERFPDRLIRVVNAGVPGYCIEHSLQNLRERVLPLQPDLVILYHAHNDIIEDSRAVAIAEGVVDGDEPQVTLSDRLSDFSMLYMLVSKNMAVQFGKREKAGTTKQLQAIPEGMSDGFIEQLGAIHSELEAHDVQLVLSTFITKFRPSQPIEVQRANADITAIYMPWMSMDALNQALEQYNAAIVDFAHQHGVPVIEDLESIPADEEHFADCIHFADAGCERMAERFANCLVERDLLIER